ncbi:MAG: hypothetical protein NTX85_03850 [Candidatus Nomurabacteria bacterium]|nr:hypothetical protein [Candidatus Nomurabacteria bacterium]
MKKMLFLSLILLYISTQFARAQKNPTISGWRIQDSSNKTVAWYYTASSKKVLLWGCNSIVVPYHPENQDTLTQEIEGDGFNLTMIGVKTENEIKILNSVLKRYIIIKKMPPSDAFQTIFTFYLKNKNDKYWQIKLMATTN